MSSSSVPGVMVAGAATAALWLASSGANFVHGPATQQLAAEGRPSASLRGSNAQTSTAGGSCSLLPVATLAAASAAYAARRRVARRAAASAPAEVEEEKKAPVEMPFDPKLEPGVTLPLMYFDPAGFAKMGDQEGFYQLRGAELKHGRVAMLAAVGTVFSHYFKFPGFEKVPAGWQAVTTPPGTYGFLAVLALAAGLELTVAKQDPDSYPGDFGDPAGIGQDYPEWKDRELNNCRMAMLSMTGMIVAELATGKDGVEQLLTPFGDLKAE
eukprot:TRINITY_DN105315_c0_g1_i1.p2 TRINITY_DN105315_c0_g1~~TRINITY_DN105315_c0_g1_i1.p2  ORF type:complete len:269 (-),score=80.10 TRINITY_DN105315_c0_g1_i1:136-942(-)